MPWRGGKKWNGGGIRWMAIKGIPGRYGSIRYEEGGLCATRGISLDQH